MFHYVYRITNIIENKHYYGKRSCNTLPKNDLGVKYFSSSHDKLFIIDQKQNPQNYKYKIIRFFATSKDAVAFEIRLHNKFDVGINESFYNKSKQTSVGFCFSATKESNPMYGRTGKLNPMYGKTHSDATKQKISDALKGKLTGENNPMYGKTGVLNPMYGKTHSNETKQKMSEKQTGRGNSQFGTMWITNGTTNLKIKKTDIIPTGYYGGRVCEN